MTATDRLYLDHAATTPVLPEARAAIAQALESWANPSSPHADGRAARAALEKARAEIADALGWRHDVILTSGATEALAIAASRTKVPGRAYGATEHDAVGAAMGADATILPVEGNGLIDLAELDNVLAVEPALVATQQVNNETGVIQPLTEIGERVRAAGSLLLADCAQGAGKLPLPDADFIVIASHKVGGPPAEAWLLASAAGAAHAVQSSLYEAERVRFHRRLAGQVVIPAAPATNPLVRLYEAVAGSLDRAAAPFDRAMERVADKPGFIAAYAAGAIPVFRAMVPLTNNMRVVLLWLACLAGNPRTFWWIELVPLSVLAGTCLWLLRKQERRLVAAA